MLDFIFVQAERQAAFVGQAMAYNMNNGTKDFGQTATGGSKPAGDSITACLDSKRQKIVPLGEYYYADPCTLCLCSNAEFMCKQISCAPPEKCDGYIKKDPLHCCDVCVPAVVVERPNDQNSLNMKLGALTVALFLVISLVLFTLHRMRRKRLLITLRRLQSFRHRDSICSHAGNGPDNYRQSTDTAENGLFSTSLPQVLSASAAIIAEGPPPYNAAVTLPRPPESLARAPPRATAPAEPPPTYRQAMQQDVTSVRRCISQNGHRPSSVVAAAAGRHSRTSDYPDDDDDEIEARSTTTYSSSSLSSSSASSLRSSRDSLHVDDVDGEEDCCSCSHCDSGLSEERGSLSSNEVRPRSEILLTNSASYHAVPDQPPSLLGQPLPEPQASTAAEHQERRFRRPRPGTNGAAVGGNCGGSGRETKSKLCKKKLKKLMLKAKRKAGRGRRSNGEEGNASNVSNSGTTSRSTAEEGECSWRTTSSGTSFLHENNRSQISAPGVAGAMPITSL